MRIFANNYSDTIATSSIGTGDTSFDVTDASPLPALGTGESFTLTITDDLASPTKTEIVKCTAVSTNTLTVTRAQEGTTAQTWVSGDNIELRVTAAGLNDKVDSSGEAFSAESISAEVYDNGASGAFDYNNGDQQKCTLTSAGTVISFSNIPEGGMLTAVITDADTYAPDISGLGPWSGGTTPTYDKITVIHAVNANGTVRHIAGPTWAS